MRRTCSDRSCQDCRLLLVPFYCSPAEITNERPRKLVLLHIAVALDDSREIAALAVRPRRSGRSPSRNRCWGRRRHRRIAKTRSPRNQSRIRPCIRRTVAKKYGDDAGVVQGDASALPFADRTFSSAVAVLVLHHLRSSELQDRAFVEVHRVLRPGGCFCTFDIQDGWLNRVAHIKSTFVSLQPATLAARLTTAGFANISLEVRSGVFRFHASRKIN